MPVHKNTTCALQTGYKPTSLCIKTQHVHFEKAINPHSCAQNHGLKDQKMLPKQLKPTCLCTKNEHRRADSSRKSFRPKAQRYGVTRHSRTRTASPRPHARTNRNRNRSPGSGGTHSTHSPKPPIYGISRYGIYGICTYMGIHVYIYICIYHISEVRGSELAHVAAPSNQEIDFDFDSFVRAGEAKLCGV